MCVSDNYFSGYWWLQVLIISKCMRDLLKHAVVAAFHIYAQRGADAAKRGGWRLCIK